MNHKQIGDPAKLATALLKLAEAENRPMRFIAGKDALGGVETRLLPRRHEDLENWRELSVSLELDSSSATA